MFNKDKSVNSDTNDVEGSQQHAEQHSNINGEDKIIEMEPLNSEAKAKA